MFLRALSLLVNLKHKSQNLKHKKREEKAASPNCQL